jgi:hypothetical protein
MERQPLRALVATVEHLGRRLLLAGSREGAAARATYNRKGGVQHFLAAYDLETGRLFGRFRL